MRRGCCTFVFLLCCLIGAARAASDPSAVELPPGVQVPAAAVPGPDFDVERATKSYLALLNPAQRARSDAYFEGGYWLNLFSTLWTLLACAVIVLSGVSTTLRNWAERVTIRRPLQLLLYAVPFILMLNLLTLPMDFYAGFIREHQYGMSNQTLPDWIGDLLISLLPTLVLGSAALVGMYLLLRRGGDQWWLRASVATFVFTLFLIMISPVFISPLLNDYKPLPAGPVREAVLSLARANAIPTDNVVWFDASKQTKRISANVSGLLGTTQVSLNDNLVLKTSLPEIKAVMGHEMGHYVLNHSLRHSVYLTLLFTLGFLFINRLWHGPLAGFLARHGIRDRGDAAGAPVLIALFVAFLLVATPVQNRIIYAGEAEADMFGLNAAQEPHGFATSAVRLGAYRKLEPTPLEEWLFYDHPSGRARIYASMRWLKEHPGAYHPGASFQRPE